VDLERGRLLWSKGDPKRAMAAYDSVLEYQSDNPEALWGAASSLGLQQRWKPAFEFYDRAVRVRTGIVELRCDYARDLLRAGRLKDALNQLEEARLLDPEHPTAEALRGWAFLEGGDADSARAYATRALEWGPWSDLARIVLAKAEAKRGDRKAADAALASVRERIAKNAPPEYTYRKKLSRWISIHELPAIEREFMSDDKRAGSAGGR
jgi:tetratricopeptide (TPR) repeat protein